MVLIGTIGKSPLIDGLVAAGKLDVPRHRRASGRRPSQQVVHNPLPGVRRAFVIAGSDQRGTIYGAYDVSQAHRRVALVLVGRRAGRATSDALYVLPGRHSQGTPAVKYRGFFINDENPALGTWAPGYFGPGKAPGYPGGFNAAFYAKVFEVMLRLQGQLPVAGGLGPGVRRGRPGRTTRPPRSTAS